MIGLAGLPELVEGDDLGALIADACARVGGLEPGDVVVVAQKAVSKVEGRIVDLEDVVAVSACRGARRRGGRPASGGGDLARVGRDRAVPAATLIAETRHGFVCASAGVDASNAPAAGMLVLLPLDPDASAARLRERLRALTGTSRWVWS